jgi:alkanesulfonate monooxygenase SsuD/methylene tetrahydromethanopterin reductase-like flavin-dependent oxidoreductase (luciferase family)
MLFGSFIASRVRRAKIAMLGPVMPLNNPVRVAEELAMLDVLSEGRLVIGLLRGTPNEYQVYGVNPAETREKASEGMALVLKALTEPEPFGWEGRHYQYRMVSVWPRPVQAPHPPIYVLGTSRDSGEFAARHRLGNGVSFDRFHLSGQSTAYYRQKCLDAGWEPRPEEVMFRGRIHVADSDEEALADAGLLNPPDPGARRGLSQPDSVQNAIAALDPSPRNFLAGYGSEERRPLLNFVGSPATVIEQIRDCREQTGAGVIDIMFSGVHDHTKVMRSMELFGTKVLPQVRDL